MAPTARQELVIRFVVGSYLEGVTEAEDETETE